MSNNRKSESHTLQSYAEMFKALSNPNRLRIFLRLASCCTPGTRWSAGSAADPLEEAGRACVGELGRELAVGPSTVSHHIKELYRAGLIRTEKRGQSVDCWVDPEALRALAGFFGRPFEADTNTTAGLQTVPQPGAPHE